MNIDMGMDSIDTISFKIEQSEELECDILGIFINGTHFIQMLQQYETQFESEIAGGYEGLTVDSFSSLERHFLGQLDENDYYFRDGKIQLLGCNCGIPECWPMLVHITALENTVIWSDFEQPYRSIDSPGGYWDYSKFKPLQFDREQYTNELQILKERLNL